MPLMFNARSSGFDWKAAIAALMEARNAETTKQVEPKAAAPAETVEAPETKTAAEPAIRIEISEQAATASAVVKTAVNETVASAAPAVPPVTEEIPEIVAKTAAPVADAVEETVDDAVAATGTLAAKVAGLAGLGAPVSADRAGPATMPSVETDEATEIAASRAAAIRLQTLERLQSVVSSVGAPPEAGIALAPIKQAGTAQAGAAYDAARAEQSMTGKRADIAA